MADRRAIQVSHELWRQMFTQGATTPGVRCVQGGIPENARLVCAFYHYEGLCDTPDPVFVFESDNWDSPAEEWIVEVDGQEYHTMTPVFERLDNV